MKKEDLDQELEKYRLQAEEYLLTFDHCHDEHGKLVLTQDGKKDIDKSRVNSYVEFNKNMAGEMQPIYNEFVKMYKQVGESGLLDESFITNQIKRPDWGVVYADLRRLNLYLSLLEKEVETGSHDKKAAFYTLFFRILDNTQDKDMKSRIADNDKYIKSSEKSLKKLDGDLAKAQAEYEKQNNAYLEQKKAIDDLKSQSSRTTGKKNKALQRIGELNALLQNRGSKLNDMTQELKAYTQDREDLLKQLSACKDKEEKKKLNLQINSAMKREEELQNQIDTLTVEAQSYEKEVTQVSQSLGDLSMEEMNFNQRIAEEENKLKLLSDQKNEGQTAIDKLKSEKDEINRNIEARQSDTKNLNSAMDMMRNMFKSEKKTVDVFKSFVAQIETVLKRYGINGDGSLMDDTNREAMALTGMSREEQLDFIHKVQDKSYEVEKNRQKEVKDKKK